MILCDAHAHLGKDAEWEERVRREILSLVCAARPEEARRLFSRLEGLPEAAEGARCPGSSRREPGAKGAVLPTAGLHPWYADQYMVRDMEPYIRRCPVVGEIGMDSVWCQVPLMIQEQAFREQLEMACTLKKPVILHTKGQEKAIAAILKEYPNRYLVHWYSCDAWLQEYIDLGGVSVFGLLFLGGPGCVVESGGGPDGKEDPPGPDPGGNGRTGRSFMGL